MKTIPSGLATLLAAEVSTFATCWKATRQDGTVFGFTSFSQDLIVSGVTYKASTGYTPSQLQWSAVLDVDNLEVISMLNSASITDADIYAGLWDYCAIEVFYVNWVDTTQGTIKLIKGHLGVVNSGKTQFHAELRGMMQALQQTVGRIYTAACNADFADSRCAAPGGGVASLAAFTVTGAVTSVTSNGVFIDTSRTEADIVTHATVSLPVASPGIVGWTAHGLVTGSPVSFTNSGGALPTGVVSGTTYYVIYIDANTFYLATTAGNALANIPINFTGSSTGTDTGYQGTPVGWFTAGLIKFTSGLNNGFSGNVKLYESATKKITLQIQMPYTVTVGDTYSMSAGCLKRFQQDCVTKFSNAINFRGFPYVPGTDALISGVS